MRVTITCEDCGERHKLERNVVDPGPIWIVCHSCELPLQAILDEPVATPKKSHSVWGGILDLGSGVRREA